MFSTVLYGCLPALVAGIGVMYALIYLNNEHRISWIEYGLGAAAIVLVLGPLVAIIGWGISRADKLTHHEYWNGFELTASREDIACEEDGWCAYTYDCHPYVVYVSQTCSSTDSQGNTTTYECGHYETRYHQCPYVTVETNYVVNTTLGAYTISAHRFPDNPQEHRWDTDESIPASVIARAETGIPKFWAEAKNRVDSGWPGPVTVRKDYDNYILASDNTILKQYSADVTQYQQEHLLPVVSSEIHDFYLADKVHFVGYRPRAGDDWQTALNRLNAALGLELQGDVQLVIVRSAVVDEDPDRYALALKAYWQDKKSFDKDVLSKNAIGIVVGTRDGKTISWARAFTGMPLGNEQMIVALESGLKGHSLVPATVIGSIRTTYQVVNDQAGGVTRRIARTSHAGVIASILWGDADKSTRFMRIGMTGKGTGHGSGFLYLNSEIGPSSGQKTWMAFIIFFLSCGVWWIAAMAGTEYWPGMRSRY